MPQYPLPFPHEPITFSYIDRRDTIVANSDLKEIARILMITRGFGTICNQDLLAEAMYEYAIANERCTIAGRQNPDRKTKGIFRLENVLSGGSKISVKEVEVLWKALNHAFGAPVAAKFAPRELAGMSVLEFKRRLVDATAMLPRDATPEMQLQILASMAPTNRLRIAPTFMGSQRVGAVPGSALASARTLGHYDRVERGHRFMLEIDGLSEGTDLLVIEAARDPIDLSETSHPQVFPAGWLRGTAERCEVGTAQGMFEVGAATGQFTYFAINGKLDKLSFPAVRMQPEASPFSPDEAVILVETLFAALHDQSNL